MAWALYSKVLFCKVFCTYSVLRAWRLPTLGDSTPENPMDDNVLKLIEKISKSKTYEEISYSTNNTTSKI